MSQDLLELARNYFLGRTVRQVSTAFGESESRLSTALRSAVPLALGGLLARWQQPAGAAELFGLAQLVHRQGLLADPSGLLSGLSPTPAANGDLPGRGADMMRTLLGAGYAPAVAGVSQQAGVQPGTATNLLSLAVAVALGLLGRHAAQNSLDASDLGSYLEGQRGTILNALGKLPGGLGTVVLPGLAHPASSAPGAEAAPAARPAEIPMTFVGDGALAARAPAAAGGGQPAILTSPAAAASGLPATPHPARDPVAAPANRPLANRAPVRQVERSPAPAPATGGWRRWPWLLLLLLGLAALLYLLRGRPAPPVASEPATSATTVAAATAAAEPAVAGRRTTLQLPGGPAVQVSGSAAEALLFRFLSDSARVVSSDNTRDWLSLDQVAFEPGTGTLTPASRTQLANLASMLQAFPAAAIKFGGHAQGQGPGDADLLRSADCANAVRTALLKNGIAPYRVVAQGYGRASPLAGNATPQDQARSCRVYVRVTKK